MEGFTIIDGIVAVVIVLSAILAYSRGLVREVMAIAGWVAAAIVAFMFAPAAEPLVREIPGLSGFLGESCELGMMVAFFVVFALALVVASLFTPLFSSFVQRSALGGIDQGLGFLFGVARGVLLVAIALMIYAATMAQPGIPMVDNSRTAQVFGGFQDNLNENIPSDAPGWIVARYEQLVGNCVR